VPREVHLTRAPTAAPAAPSPGAKDAPKTPQVRWDGTVVMALPAAR
jgi:general secretion pathway protein M